MAPPSHGWACRGYSRHALTHQQGTGLGYSMDGTAGGSQTEFERNLIVERTRAGPAAARDRGRRGGRPPKLSDRQLAMAETALADPTHTGAEVAAQFGVHRSTLLRQLKAYRQRRDAKKGTAEAIRPLS